MLSVSGVIFIGFIGMLCALPFYGNDTLIVLTGEHDLTNPTHIALLKYMQIVSHIGLFILPAIIYAKMFEPGGRSFFLTQRKISFAILLIGGFVMMLMLPVVNFLGEINAGMQIPQSIKELEEWMRTTEDQAEIVITAFIGQTEWYALIINMFMIAIIPAIGEELIFRGVVLQNFKKWSGNIHVAIIVSSLIFSAIHIQFFSFLPRFFLGIILGYMFYWTGSLKLPIFAHFANNGIAVVVAWMHASGYTNQDINTFGNFNQSNFQLILLSCIAFAAFALLWFINKKANPYFKNTDPLI